MSKLENIANDLQIISTDGDDKDIDAIDLFEEILIHREMVDNNMNIMIIMLYYII